MLANVQRYTETCINLRVGRQTNAGNLGNLAEELADSILLSVEGQVTDEESLALGAESVTVALGTVGGAVTGLGLGRLGVGVVEVEGTAVNLLALHSLVRLGGRLGVAKVDVAETTAAASVLVGDDTGADKTTEGLESLVQSIVIDTPAEGAGEQGSGSVVVSLGLLGGLGNVIISLALLGGSSLSLLLLLIGVRVVAVVRVIRVGILQSC